MAPNFSTIVRLAALLLTAHCAPAQIVITNAYDVASNYVSPWSGGNRGFGFGPWTLRTSGGGSLLQYGGFDLWNNTPLSSTTANRTFNFPLSEGGTFSVQLSNQGLFTNDINGFELEDVNGNVLFELYWQGGDNANGHYIDGSGSGIATNFTFNANNFSTYVFTLTGTASYTLRDATTGTSFNGILSGAPITQITFLRANNGSESTGGYGQDFTINNLFITTAETSVADASFDAYIADFIVRPNGQTFFIDSLTNRTYAYMWGQALEIQMVEDSYDRTENGTQLQLVTNLLNAFMANNNGSNWSWDTWNDDVEWAIIPFIRGYQMTGNTTYLNAAATNWNMVYDRGWDSTFGGGIWEEMESKASKCALSNDPFIISGCALYSATGNSSYLTKCQQVYTWVRSQLFNANTGQIIEGIATNGTAQGVQQISDNVYNSGAFVNAANALHNITGSIGYYNDALLAANHVINENSILNNSGRAGTTWEDQYVRGLSYFARDNNLLNVYYAWLAANAKAAWSARRSDLNITWNDWTSPTLMGNSFSLECLSAAVIQQVLPTAAFGAPIFTIQPLNQVSAVGNAVRLSSLATNGLPVFYQWYHGTNPVVGATSSNLVLVRVGASDAGNYWVVASNSVGSAYSQVAQVILFGITNSAAQDSASNYMARTAFGNQNQGYGFGSWVLSISGGGDFIANPSAFDLWNFTPLAASTANRTFNVPLTVGGAFSVQLRNGDLAATNINGFELQDAGGNVLFKFYWQAGDNANGHFLDSGENGTAVGFAFNSGNFSSFTFALNSATTYTFQDNTANAKFTGTLSGSPITQVTLFRINNGSETLSDGQDFQFNNLTISVVPVAPSSSKLTLTKIPQGRDICFAVAPGYAYSVQSATNVTGSWIDIGTLTAPVSGLSEFIDTNAPVIQMFYRTVTP